MKLFKIFEDLINQVKTYLNNEVEILRLRALSLIASLLARAYALTFLIISFNITLVLVGLWLGFWLSEVLGSQTLGFGAAALIFIFFLIVLTIFHRALLIRPFENLVIRIYHQSRNEKQEDEKENQKTPAKENLKSSKDEK